MTYPRFTIRSLLACVTLIALLVGAISWASRRYGDVRLIDTTPQIANEALRGFACVPTNATKVNVRFTPFHVATINFSLDATQTRRWCSENDWQVTDDSRGQGFKFKTPTGSGRWFHGDVVYIVFNE